MNSYSHSKKEEVFMQIKKIIGSTCKTTRPLWEEVFYEDSVQFTDYYFENKAEKNIGYVIGQAPYDAMMFRTPYTIQIGGIQKKISYIVGVATRKECRHRGYMRELLMYSFREMYQEKNPFTFLMPANPAIYEPFDFKYVYERDVWKLKEEETGIAFLEALTAEEKEEENKRQKTSTWNIFEKEGVFREILKKKSEISEHRILWEGEEEREIESENVLRAAEYTGSDYAEYGTDYELNGLYSVRSLQKHFPEIPIMYHLAEFANEYLKERYNIYVRRDASYYEMQLKESEAQNGDIYVLFEQGEIKAFFLYAKEGSEVFIQEVMEKEERILDFLQKSEKKKPIIMARIIHLEEMMKLICGKENTTMVIEIEDELIPENSGVFHWEITPDGSKVTKIQSKISAWESVEDSEIEAVVPEVSMHIRDFSDWILTGVFINEIV